MAYKYIQKCLRYTKYAAGTVFITSMTSAWYYRPLADTSTGTHDNYKPTINDNTQSSTKNQAPILSTDSIATPTINDRSSQFFCAPTQPNWSSRDEVPILLSWARSISIGVTTLAIRLLMNTYGKYEIKDDVHYHEFLRAVLERDMDTKTDGGRKERQGLLTISNHRSLFDDPGIVSCLLPLPQAIQPKYNRWGICSQEYCFNDALPGIIKGYLGAGQVLPICRGKGINQQLLQHFAGFLACGEWCHLFPEGGVWQWNELGGRRELPKNAIIGASSDFGKRNNASDSEDDRIRIIPATTQQRALPVNPSKGKLKWGTGKLIAHAPVIPKVIPFAHVGMEKLLPQDEVTGKTRLRDNLLRSMLPSILGGEEEDKLSVKVQFGQEIMFDDLIHEHEQKYGKLWKYSGPNNNEEGSATSRWNSSYEERILYNKIVQRIEDRLDILTKQVCQDEKD